jgi:hypothetical protein
MDLDYYIKSDLTYRVVKQLKRLTKEYERKVLSD